RGHEAWGLPLLTTLPDGSRASSRPNIFGGKDVSTPRGTIRSRPNIFGGRDYELPDGSRTESRPNIFGGQDLRGQGGMITTCRPNIFGGKDCRRESPRAISERPDRATGDLRTASIRDGLTRLVRRDLVGVGEPRRRQARERRGVALQHGVEEVEREEVHDAVRVPPRQMARLAGLVEAADDRTQVPRHL